MGFLAAFLSRDWVQSHQRPFGPRGMSVLRPMCGHGGSSHCWLLSAETFSRSSSLFFLALPFLVSYDGRSERLPWVGKGEQSHCHLAMPPGKGHCPRGQDLLLPPSRPSELNPSCFLVYTLASQGNINKFADIRTSWPHLFSCAKFSLSAMCPGHACQRAVASAGPSPSLKGLHDS